MPRALFAFVASLAIAASAAAELPLRAADAHLGVKTCSGSPCHGAVTPAGKVVLQNEHTTWMRNDRHANAYFSLTDEAGKRIARNLGIGDPTEAAECLGCHADHVPAERRGELFQLEDGVGCEACHGGAERWLQAHAAGGSDHVRNRELGMYPTDQALARAELCLSCHFGTGERFVSHRLMGAGHPRMPFELDTFSAVQPAHHVADADYVERGKQDPLAAQVWAIGQAIIVREMLGALADPARNRDGIWPEFVFFDCHACHHPMENVRWEPRATTGLGKRPGIARLNDSSLLMLYHVLREVDPAAAERVREGTLELHAAMSRGVGDPTQVARALHAEVVAALPAIAAWSFDPESVRRITESLIDEGVQGEYVDYASSEQAIMAIQALAASLHRMERLDRTTLAALNDEIGKLLTAVEDDDDFDPSRVPFLLRRLQAALPAPLRTGQTNQRNR